MNPVLARLSARPCTYDELRDIPNVDYLLRLSLKRQEIVMDHGNPTRYRPFARLQDRPEIVRPKRKSMTFEQAKERKRLIDSKRIRCKMCKGRLSRDRFVVNGRLQKDCNKCRKYLSLGREAA